MEYGAVRNVRSTKNWTGNYDVYIRRCEAMSILKVNVIRDATPRESEDV